MTKKLRFTIILFLGLLFFFSWNCKNQEREKNNSNIKLLNNSIETILTDTSQIKWICKDFNELWNPNSRDLNQIENLICTAIKKEKNEYWTLLDTLTFQKYYRQYYFYINNQGDSIVYVNAFCELMNSPIDSSGVMILKPFDWRKNLLIVEDGGDCFWTIKINLSKMTYFDFTINGVG